MASAVGHGRSALAPPALVVRAIGARAGLLPLGVRAGTTVPAVGVTARMRSVNKKESQKTY